MALEDFSETEGIVNWKLLTPQEHQLKASGVGQYGYNKEWYVPCAVQDGQEIEKVDKIRKKMEIYRACSFYWEKEEGKTLNLIVEVELAPLNLQTGETLHDPKLVQGNLEFNRKFIERIRPRK